MLGHGQEGEWLLAKMPTVSSQFDADFDDVFVRMDFHIDRLVTKIRLLPPAVQTSKDHIGHFVPHQEISNGAAPRLTAL